MYSTFWLDGHFGHMNYPFLSRIARVVMSLTVTNAPLESVCLFDAAICGRPTEAKVVHADVICQRILINRDPNLCMFSFKVCVQKLRSGTDKKLQCKFQKLLKT